LHCDTERAKQLVELSRDVDVVVGAGDFGNLRRGLDRSIDVLRSIDKPTVLVPGNSESEDELREACRLWPSAHVLHGSGVTIRLFRRISGCKRGDRRTSLNRKTSARARQKGAAPYRLRRRIDPLERRARADATAKAEGAQRHVLKWFCSCDSWRRKLHGNLIPETSKPAKQRKH
jgi:hypothetical protein